jgi:DNA-binding beta-propeller fold protein YncE
MSNPTRFTVVSILALTFLCSLTLAQDSVGIGVTNSTNNPLQIAILHWYDANLTTTFLVGRGPEWMAFDGDSLWVANFFGNNVTKLQPSTGKVLGTFGVGMGPFGVAFDGANVWVTNLLGNSVSKLRTSDGKLLGTFALGNGATPFGVAFDGNDVWVVNGNDGTVTKLRARDGKRLGTFPVGCFPYAVAFDGTSIWVTLCNNAVAKIASDGEVLGTFPVGSFPRGVVFDGANIWVANGSNSVTKLRAGDGKVLGTFDVGAEAEGMAFDGTNIWVSHGGPSQTVSKLKRATIDSASLIAVVTSPHNVSGVKHVLSVLARALRRGAAPFPQMGCFPKRQNGLIPAQTATAININRHAAAVHHQPVMYSSLDPQQRIWRA